MLYLDSSALIKRYVREAGSEKLRSKLQAESQIFTSALAFAEIHAALARRTKDKSISTTESVAARAKFDSDWAVSVGVVDLVPAVLSIVRRLVDQFALRGADLVHLASALWLRDSAGTSISGGAVLFLVSDKQLARSAAASGLAVFDPESAP